jgi:hypothetical protein
LVRIISDLPLTVAVVVLMRALELLGVVAAAVGVLLLPELVEPPQAATAIASKRTMVIGKVRLRYIISFLLSWSVKIGLC